MIELKNGDRVITNKIGVVAKGVVYDKIDGYSYEQSYPKAKKWDKNYPGWRDKEVIFVYLDNLTPQYSYAEYCQSYNVAVTRKDYESTLPYYMRLAVPTEDLTLIEETKSITHPLGRGVCQKQKKELDSN